MRLTHWINVLCMTLLLLSGLQIFNAHPALYWGNASDFDNPILAMGSVLSENGRPIGVTEIFGRRFETTGFLGLMEAPRVGLAQRGFPPWLTLPSYQDLAMGRRWHFFFAWIFVVNGLVYVGYTLLGGHWRHFAPTVEQLRHIGGTIRDHLLLRFAAGEDADIYNVLQKLAYLTIVFVVVPILILAGFTMSPALNAKFPWLVELFGGRQSARTIHFIAAALVLAFVFLHVAMVLLSGAWNKMRSMITGRYRIEEEGPNAAE